MAEQPAFTDAARDNASNVAYLAERFHAAYFGNDPEWPSWLADLRAACRRLDEEEGHANR